MTPTQQTRRFEGVPHQVPTGTVYDSTAAWYITRWAVQAGLPKSNPGTTAQLLDELGSLPRFTVHLDSPGFHRVAVAHVFQDGSRAIRARPLLQQEGPGALIRLTGIAQAGDTLTLDYGYDPPVATSNTPLEGNRHPRTPSLPVPSTRSRAATDLVDAVRSSIVAQHPQTGAAINNRRRITPGDAPWFGPPPSTQGPNDTQNRDKVTQAMLDIFQQASRQSDHAVHWHASSLMTTLLARPARHVVEAFIPTGPRWFGSNGVELHPLVRAVGLAQSAELSHMETLLHQALYRRDNTATHQALRSLNLLAQWAQQTTSHSCREHQVAPATGSPTNQQTAQAQELNAIAGTAFAQDMYRSSPDLARHFEHAIDPNNRTEQPWATTSPDTQSAQAIFDAWRRTIQGPPPGAKDTAQALTPAQRNHLAIDLVHLMTHRASVQCRNILNPHERTDAGLPDTQTIPTGETLDPQSAHPVQRLIAQNTLDHISATQQNLIRALLALKPHAFLAHAARIPQAHHILSQLVTAMEIPEHLSPHLQETMSALLQRRNQRLARTLAAHLHREGQTGKSRERTQTDTPHGPDGQQAVQEEFLARLMTGDQRRLRQYLQEDQDHLPRHSGTIPAPQPQAAQGYTFTPSNDPPDLSPVRPRSTFQEPPPPSGDTTPGQGLHGSRENTQQGQPTNRALPELVAIDPQDWPNPTWARAHISPGFHTASSSSDPDAEHMPDRYTFYLRPSTAIYQFTGQHDADGRPLYRLEYHDPRSGHPDHH